MGAEDTFTKLAQQGQDAVMTATRSWADAMQRMSGQSGGSFTDVSAVVDSVFDVAERLLETQREFTKSVLQALTDTAGGVAESARAAGSATGQSGAPDSASTSGS